MVDKMEDDEILSEGLESLEEAVVLEEALENVQDEEEWASVLPDPEIELPQSEDDEEEIEIIPIRPNEFTCSSCFLVLPKTLLANKSKKRCRDCQ